MAMMCARWVVTSALFSLFEGLPKPHFCCFIFENSFCGLEIFIQELQKRLPEKSACTAFRWPF